jgi:hypothetical protein
VNQTRAFKDRRVPLRKAQSFRIYERDFEVQGYCPRRQAGTRRIGRQRMGALFRAGWGPLTVQAPRRLQAHSALTVAAYTGAFGVLHHSKSGYCLQRRLDCWTKRSQAKPLDHN